MKKNNFNRTLKKRKILYGGAGFSQFKFMTWNIYNPIFTNIDHVKKIEESILNIKPDILCVQETALSNIDNYNTLSVHFKHEKGSTLWNPEKFNLFAAYYSNIFSYKKNNNQQKINNIINNNIDDIKTIEKCLTKIDLSKIPDINCDYDNRPIIITILQDKKTNTYLIVINIWLEHEKQYEFSRYYINYDNFEKFIEKSINLIQDQHKELADNCKIIVSGDMNEFYSNEKKKVFTKFNLKLTNSDDDEQTCCYNSKNILQDLQNNNNKSYKVNFKSDLIYTNIDNYISNVEKNYLSDHLPVICYFNYDNNYGYDFDGVVHTCVKKPIGNFPEGYNNRHPIDNMINIFNNYKEECIFSKVIDDMKKNHTNGNIFIISANSEKWRDDIFKLLTNNNINITIDQIKMDQYLKIYALKKYKIIQFIDDSWSHIKTILNDKDHLIKLQHLYFAIPEHKDFYLIDLKKNIIENQDYILKFITDKAAAEKAAAEKAKAKAEVAKAEAEKAAVETAAKEKAALPYYKQEYENGNENIIIGNFIENGKKKTFKEVFEKMSKDRDFCKYFNDKLGINKFKVFFWECPELNKNSINQPYKHTILNAGELLPKETANSLEFETYNSKFKNCNKINEIAVFSNLNNDASLITPCDTYSFEDKNKFKNIAHFVRAEDIDEVQKNLWQKVATLLLDEIENKNKTIYLNTDGRGVPWLHVRFDKTNKYYNDHRLIANNKKKEFQSPIEPAAAEPPAAEPPAAEPAAAKPAPAAEPAAAKPAPAAAEPPPAAEPAVAEPPPAAEPAAGTEAPGAVLAKPAQPPPAAHYDSNTSDNFVSNILNTDIDFTNSSNVGLYMALMGLGTAVTFLIL